MKLLSQFIKKSEKIYKQLIYYIYKNRDNY